MKVLSVRLILLVGVVYVKVALYRGFHVFCYSCAHWGLRARSSLLSIDFFV